MKSLGGGVSPLLSFALWIGNLFNGSVKKARRQQQRAEAAAFAAEQERKVQQNNVDVMHRVVDCHKGYSAEVFSLFVSGSRRVSTFRMLNPGDRVDLKMTGEGIKVFASGEYMADIIEPGNSHLPEVFAGGVPFDAYLGGRDRAYIYNDSADFCSIIVFYKLPGVPPTEVNLK